MNIMFSNQIAFNGMIPLKKYKGPILKLTNEETAKIAVLQENINNAAMEIYNLNRMFGGKHLTVSQRDYYLNKLYSLEACINELKQMIREIKINRLNKQKNL